MADEQNTDAAPAVNATDETGPWTFRHASIRTWQVGDFRFENYLMTIPEGDVDRYNAWIALFDTLPAQEKIGVTRYRAELLASLDAPIAAPSTILGTTKTNQVTDLKIQSGSVTTPATTTK